MMHILYAISTISIAWFKVNFETIKNYSIKGQYLDLAVDECDIKDVDKEDYEDVIMNEEQWNFRGAGIT